MKYALFFLLSLHLTLGSLFAHESGKELKVEVLAKTTKSWNGSALPQFPKGTPEIRILKIDIPPKTKLPMHKHPVINAGVMTKGSLKVTTQDGDVLYLKEGDSIVEVVDTWHYGENESDEACQIIVFYAGIKGEAVTIKK